MILALSKVLLAKFRHGRAFIHYRIWAKGGGGGEVEGGTHHTLRYRIHGKDGDFGEGLWST